MRAFRLTTLAFTLTLALPLAACGGSATVTETDASTTPAAATAKSTATSTATTTATSTTTTTSAGSGGAVVPSAGPVDKPASAIESVPAQASQFTAEEQSFLDHLRENGLNVAGVEEQLTATGLNVCANDTITRDAVAGQLVEQRRTDMTPEALGQLITDAARANLC